MTQETASCAGSTATRASRLMRWATARRSLLMAWFTLFAVGLATVALAHLAGGNELRRGARGALRHRPLASGGGAGADGGQLRGAHALRLQRLRRDRPTAVLGANRPRGGGGLCRRPDRGLRPVERRRDPAALLHAARGQPGRDREGRRLRHLRLRRRPRAHRGRRRALGSRDARRDHAYLRGLDRRDRAGDPDRGRRSSLPAPATGSRSPVSRGGRSSCRRSA